tara:strand:- start:1621 stop:1932 length:312 start_codon:yes stop_codon:yes gene_type:complete
MSHTDAEIAGRTKKQLGGRMFCLMTGAKNFVALNGGGLSFKVGRNCKGVNRVSVLYDTASDLYDVEFGRLRGSQYKVLTKIDGVYCDQLQSVFTTHTGLETRI